MLSLSEQAFTKTVLSAAQPVLVHFSAPWCSVCLLIEPLLVTFQAETEERLKIVQINADKSLKLANRYNLKSLPTLILFVKGKVAYRVDAIKGRDDLQQQLQALGRYAFPQSSWEGNFL